MSTPYFDSLPPELALEAQRIQRKQALADALLKQSLQPHQQQMVGGRVIRMSPLEGIGQLAGAYFGAKGQQEGDEAMAALGRKYNAGLSSAVTEYMNKRQGVPASSEQIIDEQAQDGEGAPATINAPAVPPKPMEAIVGAMTSGYKPLQMLGMKELETLGKNSMTTKDWLGLARYFDPKSAVVAAQTGDASQLKLKPEYKVVDGRVISIGDGGEVKELRDFARQWTTGTMQGPSGPLLVQREAGTGKVDAIDKAPKVSSNVNVSQAGPKVGAQEIFRQAAKDISDLAERARSAQGLQQALGQMKNLDSQGIYSNAPSAAATFVTNLAQAVGATLTPEQQTKLANTETFNSVAVDLWQQLVAQYGGNRGVTKEEAEQIKAILPQAKNSPEARQKIYRILESSAQRSINRFQVGNAAYVKALQTDNPTHWTEFLGEAFLPTTPNLPAPEYPKPQGQLRPLPPGAR